MLEALIIVFGGCFTSAVAAITVYLSRKNHDEHETQRRRTAVEETQRTERLKAEGLLEIERNKQLMLENQKLELEIQRALPPGESVPQTRPFR